MGIIQREVRYGPDTLDYLHDSDYLNPMCGVNPSQSLWVQVISSVNCFKPTDD